MNQCVWASHSLRAPESVSCSFCQEVTCFQAKGLHISITVGVPTDPWGGSRESDCVWQARILLGWALILKSDCQDLIPISMAPEPYSQRHRCTFFISRVGSLGFPWDLLPGWQCMQ